MTSQLGNCSSERFTIPMEEDEYAVICDRPTLQNGAKEIKFQKYNKRHVYHMVKLKTEVPNHNGAIIEDDAKRNANAHNRKPPLPPKPNFVCNNNRRHVYYTIDRSFADKDDNMQSHSRKNTNINGISITPPPVPPRELNTEAMERRKKLDTEYFEDLRKTVGNQLLDLAEENDLPISNNPNRIDLERYQDYPQNYAQGLITSPSFNILETGLYKRHLVGNVLAKNILVLKKCGWYWGNLSWIDAENLLATSNVPGSFLIRDSQDPKHLLTVTARSTINTVHHIRLEHMDGKFQLYVPGDMVSSSAEQCVRHANIIKFVELAMRHSQLGTFTYYVKPKNMGEPPIQIRLLSPISRFAAMKSLKYFCRLTIRDSVLPYDIDKLPLPPKMLRYLKEPQYYDPKECF